MTSLLPAEQQPDLSSESVLQLTQAYGMRLAYGLLSLARTPFSRVIERVSATHGCFRRDVSVEWELPTLSSALPGSLDILSPTVLAGCARNMDELIIPLMPMRKGQLLSTFAVSNADGSVAHICGRDEARVYTKQLLTFIWKTFERSIQGRGQLSGDACTTLEANAKRFVRIADLETADAERELEDITKEVADLRLQFTSGSEPRSVLSLGRYFAKRYLFWVRVKAHPGEHIRLEYRYKTRSDTGYDPPKLRNLFGALGRIKRFVGQEPNHYLIPVSRHGLASSYHFEMQVPEDCYVRSQGFVLEQDRSRRGKLQRENIRTLARKSGGVVQGDDEAGAAFAHLYAYRLPSQVRNQVYASVEVEERPPGTTAVVMWLTAFATLAAFILYASWPQVNQVDLRGIDIAALFAALPGVAAAWFSRAFQHEGRFRVPLVSRLGLAATGVGAAMLVIIVLLRRGVCGGKAESDNARPEACNAFVDRVSSQGVLLGLLLFLAALSLCLLFTRVVMHVRYRNCQGRVFAKYSR